MSTAPRLTINLKALAENWKLLDEKSGKAEASAVVKGDAYGLGILDIMPSLVEAGCKTFFVAMVEEGVRVRSVAPDARIFILNGVLPERLEPVLEHNLSPVLSSMEQIEFWVKSAPGHKSAIHVDTGMHRLGISLEEAGHLANSHELIARSGATVLMSHFACADDPDHEMNEIQLARFKQVESQFNGLQLSLANSAAVLSKPDALFNLTRPGISIYGAEAVNNQPNTMKPVVTAEARILQIRAGRKGETVGYGATHKLTRNSRIAICSAGYADGFHRSGSGSGVALRNVDGVCAEGTIGKYRIPVLGRISMDITAFDVTDIPEQVLNDIQWIELFGHNISIDDAARACGTIGYELLTSLGTRYHREYVG